MGKFKTEGSVGIIGFANFIREETDQFNGYGVEKSFLAAQSAGAFLPQGDFIAPHALSESYGAEAGFRFWVNNNSNGTKNKTSAGSGVFVGSFYWSLTGLLKLEGKRMLCLFRITIICIMLIAQIRKIKHLALGNQDIELLMVDCFILMSLNLL